MTPDEYLTSFVEGNLADCREEPGDLRRAFNAAVSASHLADTYYNYNLRHHPHRVESFSSLGTFVQRLADETNGGFRDLRCIANVYKHLYVGPAHLAYATILSGGALETVHSEDPDGAVAKVDAGYEPDREGVIGRLYVRYKRKDGTTGEFLPVLVSFVEYWYREFAFQTPP